MYWLFTLHFVKWLYSVADSESAHEKTVRWSRWECAGDVSESDDLVSRGHSSYPRKYNCIFWSGAISSNSDAMLRNCAVCVGLVRLCFYIFSKIVRRRWKTTFLGTGECSKSGPIQADTVILYRHPTRKLNFYTDTNTGVAQGLFTWCRDFGLTSPYCTRAR